jgi:hypothetical protein
MSPDFDNQWLDEALRNINVPESVAARLNEIGTCSDSDLDAALRGSPPRSVLRDRLLAVGTLSDQDLADELRDVRVPGELLARCREIPRTEPVTGLPLLRRVGWLEARPWLQYAVAASLMLFLGGWSIQQFGPTATPVPQPQPIAVIPTPENNWVIVDPVNPEQYLPHPMLEMPGQNTTFPEIAPSTNLVTKPLPQTNPPVPDLTAPKYPANPINDRDLFGTNPGTQALPDLVSVGEPENRGLRPPNVREFDLLFLLRHGVHPFVSPSAHAELAKVQVPLVSTTASYQRALEKVRQAETSREDLRSEDVRVEEFLAAMDYEFARPASSDAPGLNLHTAGGISPWSDHGLGLMQIGIQAGNITRAPESAAHLVLAIETSSAMARPGSWNLLCRNLRSNFAELLPTDRVSILVVGERPRLLGRAVTPEQALKLLSQVEATTPRGNANLVAALPELASLLKADHESKPKLPTKAVLLTAGMLHLDQTQLAHWSDEIRPLLAESKNSLNVVDLRQNEVLDPLLTALAGWSHKPVQRANEGRQLDLRLREIQSGQPQVVAHDVSLRINFVPNAVSLYRLLGHEASAVSNLIPLEWQTDLHSGETATALFEIAVRPNGPEIIAHATLEWRDMAGKPHTRKQPISRLQFAPSFAEAPRSLHLAALAAETAEVLRGSYFAPIATHDLGQVRSIGQRLPLRTRQTSSYRQLEQFWQSNVKPARL